MEKLRILVNGCNGKMGRAISAGIAKEPDIELAAAVDINNCGADFNAIIGLQEYSLFIEGDLKNAINRTKPDIMLDLTDHQTVKQSVYIALDAKTPCVVGTSGLTEDDKNALTARCRQNNTPLLLIPNFALGAVLMMKFAAEAARYFPHAEIVEMHHDQKLDAPSGTALSTLAQMNENRAGLHQGAVGETEKIAGARGGAYNGMRVHSIRLPGYVASQEVLFGGMGQILSIRHDSLNRDSFIPGVLLSLRKVRALHGLVTGLESLL